MCIRFRYKNEIEETSNRGRKTDDKSQDGGGQYENDGLVHVHSADQESSCAEGANDLPTEESRSANEKKKGRQGTRHSGGGEKQNDRTPSSLDCSRMLVDMEASREKKHKNRATTVVKSKNAFRAPVTFSCGKQGGVDAG